jgi:hypothetical protein
VGTWLQVLVALSAFALVVTAPPATAPPATAQPATAQPATPEDGGDELRRLPVEAVALVRELATRCDGGDDDACVDLARHYLEGLLAPGLEPALELRARGFALATAACERGARAGCEVGQRWCDEHRRVPDGLRLCWMEASARCRANPESGACDDPLARLEIGQVEALRELDRDTRSLAAALDEVAAALGSLPDRESGPEPRARVRQAVERVLAIDQLIWGEAAAISGPMSPAQPDTLSAACARATDRERGEAPPEGSGADGGSAAERAVERLGWLLAVGECLESRLTTLDEALVLGVGAELSPLPELPEPIRAVAREATAGRAEDGGGRPAAERLAELLARVRAASGGPSR